MKWSKTGHGNACLSMRTNYAESVIFIDVICYARAWTVSRSLDGGNGVLLYANFDKLETVNCHWCGWADFTLLDIARSEQGRMRNIRSLKT